MLSENHCNIAISVIFIENYWTFLTEVVLVLKTQSPILRLKSNQKIAKIFIHSIQLTVAAAAYNKKCLFFYNVY